MPINGLIMQGIWDIDLIFHLIDKYEYEMSLFYKMST